MSPKEVEELSEEKRIIYLAQLKGLSLAQLKGD